VTLRIRKKNKSKCPQITHGINSILAKKKRKRKAYKNIIGAHLKIKYVIFAEVSMHQFALLI
jgi:hypothetical protein